MRSLFLADIFSLFLFVSCFFIFLIIFYCYAVSLFAVVFLSSPLLLLLLLQALLEYIRLDMCAPYYLFSTESKSPALQRQLPSHLTENTISLSPSLSSLLSSPISSLRECTPYVYGIDPLFIWRVATPHKLQLISHVLKRGNCTIFPENCIYIFDQS